MFFILPIIGLIISVLLVVILSAGNSSRKSKKPVHTQTISDDEIFTMAQRGSTVQAINLYKDRYGGTLKAAEKAVKAMKIHSK